MKFHNAHQSVLFEIFRAILDRGVHASVYSIHLCLHDCKQRGFSRVFVYSRVSSFIPGMQEKGEQENPVFYVALWEDNV